MAYVRLSGAGAAFGWVRGRQVTLGGLQAGAAYRLICEAGETPVVPDAQGGWRGEGAGGAPLCLAAGDQPVLYDEGRVSREAAALLIGARSEKKAEPSAKKEKAPEPRREERQEEPASEAAAEEAPPVVYRAASQEPPVDALPSLQWPAAAAQLRPYFENSRPVRLLEAPQWRTVQAREGGLDCCFGYRAENDRVAEVLYGVRARGALVPPRGLQGYRYERTADGGYWVLRQGV